MITHNNFKELLHCLEFQEQNTIFTKTIGSAILEVDFEEKKIMYPENEGLVVNETQTCNFFANENFVVFECVHRL